MHNQSEKPPPWWLETLAITRAILGILFWPLVAIFGGIAALMGLIFAFAAHWGFGLLAVALIIAAIIVFVWWDRRQPPRAT